jgi:hypothetical protein
MNIIVGIELCFFFRNINPDKEPRDGGDLNKGSQLLKPCLFD